MNFQPISPHDLAAMIHSLALNGEWEGLRSGCKIRLVRYHSGARNVVQYAVRIRVTWISRQTRNVGEAVREINQLISEAPIHGSNGQRRLVAPGSKKAQLPVVPRSGHADEEWLPYPKEA